jgi:hypothetical protein
MVATRSVVCSLALIAICLFGSWLSAAEWRAVTLQGARLQVEMPGTPKVRYDKELDRDGKLDVLEIHYVVLNDTIFLANAVPVPTTAGSATDSERVDAASRGFRDGYANAPVMKQKNFTVGAIPYRELLIDDREHGLYVHWRGCVMDKQLVQAMAITKSKEPSPDIARFFQSLKPRRK